MFLNNAFYDSITIISQPRARVLLSQWRARGTALSASCSGTAKRNLIPPLHRRRSVPWSVAAHTDSWTDPQNRSGTEATWRRNGSRTDSLMITDQVKIRGESPPEAISTEEEVRPGTPCSVYPKSCSRNVSRNVKAGLNSTRPLIWAR